MITDDREKPQVSSNRPPVTVGRRKLRWLTIILPLLFWIGLVIFRRAVFGLSDPWYVVLLQMVFFLVGAGLFSAWVFRVIQQRENLIQRRTIQLSALNEAALVLTMDLDLRTVLNRVVHLACELVNARYGALGVLDENGERIGQFITSGITPEERQAIPRLPQGHGLLGALIKEGRPIRVPEISEDGRSVGFPPNHPHMHSFLGVPIKSKGTVIGNLYLTDKQSQSEPGVRIFTEEDEKIVEMFATQAAIAIENAQLYRKTQQLAVLQERERFGMDLHDGIIQSIYAIGLMLEDTELRMSKEPDIVPDRLRKTIHGLNDVIRDIRNYILDLRPQQFQGRDLIGGLDELAQELKANTFLDVELTVEDRELPTFTPEQTVDILHIAREALTNVRKHAHASKVELAVERTDGVFSMSICDDGLGLASLPGAFARGNGLRNMRERANTLNGELIISPADPSGTRIDLRIPTN